MESHETLASSLTKKQGEARSCVEKLTHEEAGQGNEDVEKSTLRSCLEQLGHPT